MYWIVQDNLYHERGYDAFCDALVRLEIPHTFVQVIPFSHELSPAPDVVNPVIVMGSTTLAKHAKKLGWVPGAFLNENSNFLAWRKHYGEELLNHDAIVCRFSETIDLLPGEEVFIRPVEDTKSFAGTLMVKYDLEKWYESVANLEISSWTSITSDELVLMADPKTIQQEFRFFVVDGEVITGSRYKLGWRVTCEEVPEGDASQVYAQRMVDKWQPDRAFCLDVALTLNGYRIIEVNCINSAGFYAADMNKLVHALNQMEF